MRQRLSLPLLAAMCIVPPPAAAQISQGVIKLRSISVELDALSARDFDTSEAIFDVPLERILALRGELEADGDMMYSEVQTSFKGNLIRSDASEEGVISWVVMDLESGTLQIVQPDEQMVMEMTSADMERMAAMSGGMPGASQEMEITETGLSREINGWSCVAYDVSNDMETTRVWVSNDDPRVSEVYRGFSEAMGKMSMGEDVDAEFVVAKHGFPVLTQRLTYSMYDIDEVVSFERGSVPADAFEVPAGYRKVNMAQMMRGIGH